MGKRCSNSLTHKHVSTPSSPAKHDPSTESHIILVGDSEWVLVNKLNDSEQECSSLNIGNNPIQDNELNNPYEEQHSTEFTDIYAFDYNNGKYNMSATEELLYLWNNRSNWRSDDSSLYESISSSDNSSHDDSKSGSNDINSLDESLCYNLLIEDYVYENSKHDNEMSTEPLLNESTDY